LLPEKRAETLSLPLPRAAIRFENAHARLTRSCALSTTRLPRLTTSVTVPVRHASRALTCEGNLSLPVIRVLVAERLMPFVLNRSTTTSRLLAALAPLRSVTTTRSAWRPTSDPRGCTLHVYGARVSVQTRREPRYTSSWRTPADAIGVTLTITPAGAMLGGTLPNVTDGAVAAAAWTTGSGLGAGGVGVTSPPTTTVAVAVATAVVVGVAVGVAVGVGVGVGVLQSIAIGVEADPVWPDESVATAVSVRCTQPTSVGTRYVSR
jgi:hypothetical protein